MIRGDLGFTGIVISDDLGNAKQVAAWSPGARAVSFINAGGDMVLTVDASVIPAMVNAVTARAASDTVFRARVQAAVLRVLTVKAQYGLLGSRLPGDGLLRRSTKAALQRWLGITQTGNLDSTTIRALQARVGAPVTGTWGPASDGRNAGLPRALSRRRHDVEHPHCRRTAALPQHSALSRVTPPAVGHWSPARARCGPATPHGRRNEPLKPTEPSRLGLGRHRELRPQDRTTRDSDSEAHVDRTPARGTSLTAGA